MTRAELRGWRDRHGLSNVDAARILGLSPSGFTNKLYGKRKVRMRVERAALNISAMLAAGIWPSGWQPPSRRRIRVVQPLPELAEIAEICAIPLK